MFRFMFGIFLSLLFVGSTISSIYSPSDVLTHDTTVIINILLLIASFILISFGLDAIYSNKKDK